MKILQVIDRMMRSGGAEKFALDLTLALDRMPDVEVEVLSIAPPTNNDFVDILRNAGIRHSVLSPKMYSLKAVWKLKRFIENGGYDVVHVHLFPALYYVGAIRMLGSFKGKLCYTEHSTSNRRRGNPVMAIADRVVYKRYDSVVAISDKVKRNLENHLRRNDVIVVNNGIDINAIASAELTDLRKECSIPSDATIVTMVSRITSGKDHTTLVKAIVDLPCDFHLVAVGDGPLRQNLETMVSLSEAMDRIHILGLRKDVYGILKASDIVVLSTEHEGFSIAMLEAMACRKPFVASSVPGIADLVDGVAELFEYQNHEQLAEILQQLKDSPTKYKEVAKRCYTFALKYEINNVARNYLQIGK